MGGISRFVQIQRLRPGVLLPAYQTLGSAGMDLYADIEAPIGLDSLERILVPTGIAIALPEDCEAQIRPRSGLSWKKGLTCLNTPGTVDADYRGELKILVINLSKTPEEIQPGERIAQLVVSRRIQVVWEEVEVLEATFRGEGGFGSTGVR
ncbi:MAG: dUTP diphosphatase [Proteobacteria bacterium]|nr:dUTP diphosphatase [Cystobacterineae bacterium]MCL2314520.1 dUTP diphosphatase [Pseudomonadota bacterium]